MNLHIFIIYNVYLQNTFYTSIIIFNLYLIIFKPM